MNEDAQPSPPSAEDLALAYAAPHAELTPRAFGKKAFFVRALLAGCACAAGAGVIDGVGYVASYHDSIRDLPVVGTVYMLFVIAEGLALGGGAGAGILGADALAARVAPGRGARPLAAVVGSVLGSLVAVLLPSALGTLYFGSRSSPYVGNVAIAVVPVVAVLLASAMIAGADARLRQRTIDRGVLLALGIVALVPLGALGVAATRLGDDAVPRWAEALFGPRASGFDYALSLCGLGAVLGGIVGAALGLHIGVTTALARWRSIPRW